MCRKYTEQADDDGEHAAARRFAELHGDEMGYPDTAAIESSDPGQPDGKGRGEPRGEDVVEGEYQEM